MLHGEQRDLFDLSFSIPSECADRLAQGRADIGLIPSIELTRQKLNIIPGAGIACRGAVRSILLVSKVPFAEIGTFAVDSSSRTSVMLSRVILAKKYGVEPLLLPRSPDLVAMLDAADACLIIGDPALLLDPVNLPFHVLDLGAEWVQMTGLPMVFAVWAARAALPIQDPAPFIDSLRFGVLQIDEIADREYMARSISRQLAHEYLTRNIVFELQEPEYEGLSLFLRLAGELQNQIDLRAVTA